MPSSSTDVACRSNDFNFFTKGDSDNMIIPSLEMSELPYKISYYSLFIQLHFEIKTRESSVI